MQWKTRWGPAHCGLCLPRPPAPPPPPSERQRCPRGWVAVPTWMTCGCYTLMITYERWQLMINDLTKEKKKRKKTTFMLRLLAEANDDGEVTRWVGRRFSRWMAGEGEVAGGFIRGSRSRASSTSCTCCTPCGGDTCYWRTCYPVNRQYLDQTLLRLLLWLNNEQY